MTRWRLGKTFDGYWAVFRIEPRHEFITPGGFVVCRPEYRQIERRFSTFELARRAFASGGAS